MLLMSVKPQPRMTQLFKTSGAEGANDGKQALAVELVWVIGVASLISAIALPATKINTCTTLAYKLKYSDPCAIFSMCDHEN